MQINLFNAKNPNGKRVPVTLNLEHVDLTPTNDGELVYIASLSTGARKTDGSTIDTVFINNINQINFKKEVQEALAIIAAQVDWGTLEDDTFAPIITEMSPKRDELEVSINQDVFIKLKDPFPASFIDTNTIKFTVNEVDVTSELQLTEKDNHITIQWTPRRILG